METETTISKTIHNSDEMSRYDAACKQLLSEKIILAWILKGCVEEFHGIDVQEIAEKCIEGTPQVGEVPVAPDEASPSMIVGAPTEDKKIREGTVNYDIRFHAVVPKSGEMLRLILNVESQYDYYPGYPLTKRGVYYCSRMISSQYGSIFAEAHYENIRKVVSIWICLRPPLKRQNTITRYRIREDNIIGEVKEQPENYDLLSLIMVCLGRTDEIDNDVLKLLGILLSSEMSPDEKCEALQEDFSIPMSQQLESEVGLMCNLSQGVFIDGMEKGIAITKAENAEKEKEWQAERDSLTAENSNLTAENSNLTAENSNLTAENSNLTAENSNLTAKLSNLTAEIARLQAQIDKLQQASV